MNAVLIMRTVLDVILCVLIVLYSITIYKIDKNKKIEKPKDDTSIDPAILAILIQDNSVDKIYSILDQLIKKAIDRYMIFNVIVDPEAYLNNQMGEELYVYVVASVMDNMSPTMISLLKLVNKIDTPEDLKKIINLEAKIYVASILVSKNKPI